MLSFLVEAAGTATEAPRRGTALGGIVIIGAVRGGIFFCIFCLSDHLGAVFVIAQGLKSSSSSAS